MVKDETSVCVCVLQRDQDLDKFRVFLEPSLGQDHRIWPRFPGLLKPGHQCGH